MLSPRVGAALISLLAVPAAAQKNVITLGVLLPAFSGKDKALSTGWQRVLTMETARINADDTILPNHKLVLDIRDVDESSVVSATLGLVDSRRPDKVYGVIGAHSSEASKIAQLLLQNYETPAGRHRN